IQALGAAQAEVTGQKPAPIIRRPGADAVHLTAYGVPCVTFGPGGRTHPDARGAGMHAFCAHAPVEELEERDVVWNLEGLGAMPAGLIEEENSVSARRDFGFDLIEVKLHS